MRRVAQSFVVACALSWLPGSALADDAGAGRETRSARWILGLAGGEARNHGRTEGSPWFDLRVGRALAGEVLRVDLGLAACGGTVAFSPAFRTATLGLEAVPFPRLRVSPFARVEAGLLAEDDYYGTLASVGGGVAVRVGKRLSVRAGLAIGNHDGQNGPNTYYGGVEYRW